jgi:hypothetical protein
MSARISDSKLACFSAAFLTGLGVLVVFGFQPGGFETQGAWLLVLLPAGVAAYPLSDFVHKVAPHADALIFWTFMVIFNLIWYWILSFAVIKLFRVRQQP